MVFRVLKTNDGKVREDNFVQPLCRWWRQLPSSFSTQTAVKISSSSHNFPQQNRGKSQQFSST